MATPNAVRQKAWRRRRKRKLVLATVEISVDELSHLARLGYTAQLEDPRSIGQAVESFIADSALSATGEAA